MNAAGIAIGLTYEGTEKRLHGCDTDANRVTEYLRSTGFKSARAVHESDGLDIIQDLNGLAFRSWRESLDVAWIHFCGHGVLEDSVECLVPRDFKQCGMISFDYIRRVVSHFNPDTTVICVFDCCYPPSLLAEISGPRVVVINGCESGKKSAGLMVIHDGIKFSGVLTTCLIDYLETKQLRDVHILDMISEIKTKIKDLGRNQIPQIYSNFEITKETKLI